MFWMLRGLYLASYGTFTPDTGLMASTNIINTQYKCGDSTKLVNMIATVDADTFRHNQILTGLGISEKYSLAKANQFFIFPNPSNGLINVQTETIVGEVVCEIIDIQGKVMFQTELNFNKKLNCFDLKLNNGIYLIQFSKGSEILHSQRLLVE